MSVVRVHRYNVDPANLDELLARRAQLIAGIGQATRPGRDQADPPRRRVLSGRVAVGHRGTMQVAAAAAANFPAVAATMALTENATVQNGEIIDER